jgi:hypothetical protein
MYTSYHLCIVLLNNFYVPGGLRCKRGEVEEIKERKAEEKISLCSSVPSLSSSRRNLAYNPL